VFWEEANGIGFAGTEQPMRHLMMINFLGLIVDSISLILILITLLVIATIVAVLVIIRKRRMRRMRRLKDIGRRYGLRLYQGSACLTRLSAWEESGRLLGTVGYTVVEGALLRVRVDLPHWGPAIALTGVLRGIDVLIIHCWRGIPLYHATPVVEVHASVTNTYCLLRQPGRQLPEFAMRPPHASGTSGPAAGVLLAGIALGPDLCASTSGDTIMVHLQKDIPLLRVEELLEASVMLFDALIEAGDGLRLMTGDQMALWEILE
jgi:hypothetical protein